MSYLADKPITNKSEDKFQRYSFAKRIAETIKARKNSESLVIGIYGAWGEGKSSILNYIDNELNTDQNIITIKFNPWRYTDEESLLMNLFKKITSSLNTDLENKKEKLGKFIKKYGAITTFLGFDLSETSKILIDTQIEEFKNRVDLLLQESGLRIVIFVDDIDRLDKTEIFSIFRIVKLTAEFANTTYILSFDENMVSEAIGDRFSSGNIEAGKSFLEKIIQVPITIPKAQPEALKNLCFSFIEENIKSSNINLTEEEIKRFVFQFTTNILSEINTPRQVVRFCNSISFSLPLLINEVNTIDLLLIEAIKIFFPLHYNLIKNEPEFFIGDYNGFIYGSENEKKDELRKKLEDLSQNKNTIEKSKIRTLLTNLFPTLNSVYSNFSYTSEDKSEWFVKKRICSDQYFKRYFSYCVIEGEISDIQFEYFLNQLKDKQIDELVLIALDILKSSKADNFIRKLRSKESSFSWEEGKKISLILCNISDLFPEGDGAFYFTGTLDQAALFISQVIEYNKTNNTFEFAKELMSYAKESRFAYSINNWLRKGDNIEDKLYTVEQYQILAKILTDRVIKEAGEISIFKLNKDYMYYLLNTWIERDKKDFIRYTKTFLNKAKENIISFLEFFVPYRMAVNGDDKYKMDITKEQYEYIISVYDKDDIFKRITKVYSIKEISKEIPYFIDHSNKKYTTLNMIRQYYKWYKSDI